jgi:hypothetical protein
MATATITLQSVCGAGGEHCIIRLTVGANNFDFTFAISDLNNPITADERQLATSIITRFHCGGMTKLEAKAELQPPGISVVTS